MIVESNDAGVGSLWARRVVLFYIVGLLHIIGCSRIGFEAMGADDGSSNADVRAYDLDTSYRDLYWSRLAGCGFARPETSVILNHHCYLNRLGSLYRWGSSEFGQLGLGHVRAQGDEPGEVSPQMAPVDLGATAPIVDVAAGPHVCVVFADGRIKCLGRNEDGQLGLGDTENHGQRDSHFARFIAPVKSWC